MSEPQSIGIDSTIKKRTDVPEEWQLREIRAGIAELDAGKGVTHEKVSKWLRSWGKPGERKAPQ